MQHEGFRRRRRSSAPTWELRPTATFDEGSRGGARISWPISSLRAQASKGSSHSRPAEGVGESHQSQVEEEKVLQRKPMRSPGRVRARALRPIPGEVEGSLHSDSESGVGGQRIWPIRELRRRALESASQSDAGAGGRARGGGRAYRGGAAGARSRGLAVPAAPTEAPRPLPTCCAALYSAWP